MEHIMYKVVIGTEHRDFNELFILENRYGVWTLPVDVNDIVVSTSPLFLYEAEYKDDDEIDFQKQAIKAALCGFNAKCYDVDGRMFGSKRYVVDNIKDILERLDAGMKLTHKAYMALKGGH